MTYDAIFGNCAYHSLLENIDIGFDSEVMTLKVDDGIRNNLARAMIGDVATALDADALYAAGSEHIRREQEILSMTMLAECEHRLVFEKKQIFSRRWQPGAFALYLRIKAGVLQLPERAVGLRLIKLHDQNLAIIRHGF